jgi:[protein-PII] uridylyltransferase
VSKDPTERRLGDILSEVENLALLRFALLFHDSGKGARSGDHARLSVELARAAMQRLQMGAEEQRAVEFLIHHHLDLSAVMSSRDLHDPSTARLLAQRIGTLERLKLLTLLTYADISAVNPGAMTPWRLDQLWEDLPRHPSTVAEGTGNRADRRCPIRTPRSIGTRRFY